MNIMTKAEGISALKQFALDHYEDGYDTFVECYGTEEWNELWDEQAEKGGTPTDTYNHCLQLMACCADVWEDRRADARNSAF